MIETITDIYRRQPLIMIAAAINLILAVLFLVGLITDSRTILGVNRWLKPFKFAFSIAMFLVTIGLFMSYLPNAGRLLSIAGGLIAATMILEIVLIGMQSWRGVTSHFNTSTSFDGAVFGTMGIAVAVSSLAVLYVLLRYFYDPPAMAPAFLWSIRLGIVVFLLGSLQGVMLVTNMAHTVGAPDGGPGLPLLNWSTKFGDLRIAHFVGLHGLQLLPLFGYYVGGRNDAARALPLSTFWVILIAGLMVTLMLLALLQAMAGKPLVRVD